MLSKTTTSSSRSRAASALALALTLAAASAQAQTLDGHHGHHGGPSAPGKGGGFAHVAGTISAIDATAGTITVAVAASGSAAATTTTLTVTSATSIIGQQSISASDIAVGDKLEVDGVPVGIDASAITDDHVTSSSSSSSSTTSTATTSGSAPVPGTLHVVGTVTSLSPAVIEVSSDLSLTLTTSSSTTFTALTTLTLAGLQTGETIDALAAQSGTTLTAGVIKVTVPAT